MACYNDVTAQDPSSRTGDAWCIRIAKYRIDCKLVVRAADIKWDENVVQLIHCFQYKCRDAQRAQTPPRPLHCPRETRCRPLLSDNISYKTIPICSVSGREK